jgi:hypothetical protein
MSEVAAAAPASASPGAGTSTQGAQGNGQQQNGKAAPAQAQGAKAQATGAPAGGTKDASQAKQAGEEKTVAEELAELTIGGKSHKVSKDLAEQIKQLEKGARKSFEEASQIKNQFVQFAKAAKENPDLFFKEFGIDPDQYSQARLAKLLENQMMTPEQKKALEQEEKLKKYEAQEKERTEKEKTEKETVEFQKADQNYRNEIATAWQDSGLPPDPMFGIEIAKVMVAAKNQGLDWTAKQAAARVKEAFVGNVGGILAKMDAEAIRQVIPKAVLDKLREHDVARVTAAQAASKQSAQTSRPAGSAASTQNGSTGSGKKMLSEKEYQEYFRSLGN